MSSRKTRVQENVVELRNACGLTQDQLARMLNVTVVTVSRWETSRPPSGQSLYKLHTFAKNSKKEEIAQVFWDALVKEPNWRNAVNEGIGVHKINITLSQIRQDKDVGLRSEYINVLSAVIRASAAQIRHYRQNNIGRPEIWESMEYNLQQLKLELENEENEQKEER